MDKNSNAYILTYAAIMTVIVAVALALLSESLKGAQEVNELLAKKADILKSVGKAEVDDVEAYFSDRIEGLVLDANGNVKEGVAAIDIDLAAEDKKAAADKMYPLYVFNSEDNSKRYIIPMRGSGLWGPIWGYIAIEDDYATIAGVSFDHETETPGLGAEITQNWFQDSFVGKSIKDNLGAFAGITVKKGALTKPDNQVGAISGATITGDGVTNMIIDDVANYLPYFESQQKTANR